MERTNVRKLQPGHYIQLHNLITHEPDQTVYQVVGFLDDKVRIRVVCPHVYGLKDEIYLLADTVVTPLTEDEYQEAHSRHYGWEDPDAVEQQGMFLTRMIGILNVLLVMLIAGVILVIIVRSGQNVQEFFANLLTGMIVIGPLVLLSVVINRAQKNWIKLMAGFLCGVAIWFSAFFLENIHEFMKALFF